MVSVRYLHVVIVIVLVSGLWGAVGVSMAEDVPGRYEQWTFGPPSDPDFFPIGVWLQDPRNAPAYKRAGINVYVGLWQGPTESQLSLLRAHGMPVIAGQNEVGLKYKDDPIILGWLQDDEPDNAQPLPEGGYGPPVPPSTVIYEYERLKAADSSRPVFLNLGQGVANDEWIGRGPDASLSDYPEYCKGTDIVSFDVYPVADTRRDDGENYLWYVAKGLDRLRSWCGEEKIIWNILETTNISSEHKVTPHQLRAEVWMSLIHGSKGIVYFVHRFQPSFIEAGLLHDREMLDAVTEINRQIHELAPVLNSPTIEGRVRVESSKDVPISVLLKEWGDAMYVFAVGMRNAPAEGRFTIEGIAQNFKVEVLGENRVIDATAGAFTDYFEAYDVHLYKISNDHLPESTR